LGWKEGLWNAFIKQNSVEVVYFGLQISAIHFCLFPFYGEKRDPDLKIFPEEIKLKLR